MKKILALLTATLLALSCLSSCGSGGAATGDGRLQIVAAIFPAYDWVMAVLGENPANAEVTLLLDTGADLHNYQPTAADILKISNCDLFLYVGGESDEWVDDALQEAVNPEIRAVSLIEFLGDSAKREERKEGMTEANHEEEEDEYDEHVWLSLDNADLFCAEIERQIEALDPANAAVYQANLTSYAAQLDEMDQRYRTLVDSAPIRTLVFGDRFPFRYLVDAYGLDYYAAFPGCSAETEASFETITFLARKVDELGLSAVMTIEGSDHRIAETIAQNTRTKDQRILALDSMQSTTAADIQNGVTYLSVMESNLSVLRDALRQES